MGCAQWMQGGAGAKWISLVNWLIFGLVCLVGSNPPDIGRDWGLFMNCALDLAADGPDE